MRGSDIGGTIDCDGAALLSSPPEPAGLAEGSTIRDVGNGGLTRAESPTDAATGDGSLGASAFEAPAYIWTLDELIGALTEPALGANEHKLFIDFVLAFSPATFVGATGTDLGRIFRRIVDAILAREDDDPKRGHERLKSFLDTVAFQLPGRPNAWFEALRDVLVSADFAPHWLLDWMFERARAIGDEAPAGWLALIHALHLKRPNWRGSAPFNAHLNRLAAELPVGASCRLYHRLRLMSRIEPALAARFERGILARSESIGPGELNQLLQDSRMLGRKNTPFIHQLVRRVHPPQPSESVGSLIHVLRQLALAGALHLPLIEDYVNEIERRGMDITPGQAAELYRALGVLHFDSEPILTRLSTILQENIGTLNSRHLGLVALGSGELMRKDDALHGAVVTRARAIGPRFQRREIPPLCWGLALVSPRRLFLDLWELVDSLMPFYCPDRESARLMYQAARFQHCELPSALARSVTVRLSEDPKPPELNGFEKSVGQALRSLGEPVIEQPLVDTVSVDFVIPRKPVPLAVFCDGIRFHCIGHCRGGRAKGSDVMANRLLALNGYAVLRITDAAWNEAVSRKRLREWLAEEVGKALADG